LDAKIKAGSKKQQVDTKMKAKIEAKQNSNT